MATRKDVLDYLRLPQVIAARYRLYSSTFLENRGDWEKKFGWKNFDDSENKAGYCFGMSRLWIRYMHEQVWPLSVVPSGGISRLWKGSLTSQAKQLHDGQAVQLGVPTDRRAWIDDHCTGAAREEFGALVANCGHTMAIYGRASYVYFYDSNYVAYTYDRSLFTITDHVISYFLTVYKNKDFAATHLFSHRYGWP